MFDVGFSELLLIAVVALVVLGPERLPRVARTAGHLLGRFQRYANQVKSDISREMQLEDMKKMQVQMQETARELETSIRAQTAAIESGVTSAVEEVRTPAVASVSAEVSSELSATELARAAEAAQADAQAAELEIARHLSQPAAPNPAASEPSQVAEDDVPPVVDEAQLALCFDPGPAAAAGDTATVTSKA